MNSGIEPSLSGDGSVALAVLDRLSACRTEADFLRTLRGLLGGLAPGAHIAVVLDPEAPDQDAIERMASQAWHAGMTIRGQGGIAVVGTDGRLPQLALAARPTTDEAGLSVLAHVAGRLLAGLRARRRESLGHDPSPQPVLHHVRELDRQPRTEGRFPVVGVVDPSVDPSLSGDEVSLELSRLRLRVRRILRPEDRLWKLGDRLVVAQVLPQPDNGLLVDRLATAVGAVHAAAGVSRRLVDAWVTARGAGADPTADLIARADRGLDRMRRLRAAGMRILAGEDPETAFGALSDASSAIVVVDSQRMLRAVSAATMSLFPEFSGSDLGDAVDTDDLIFYRPDGSVLADEEVPGAAAMASGLSVQDRLVGVSYANNKMHWALITAVAMSDNSGRMLGYVADVVPVDVPGHAVRAERMRDAADLVRSPMAILTPERDEVGEVVDFRVQQVNCAGLTALQISEEDAVGALESQLHPSADRFGQVLDYATVVETGQAVRQVLAIPEGGLMGAFEVTAEPCGDGVIVVAHSLASGTRREEMARLWDSLTGLASRQGLLVRIEDLQRQGPTTPVTLVMCDIDDFTGVNDSLGRLRSDRYLVEVGRALAQLAGPHDLVARVGSDEFAFLTSSAVTPAAAEEFAETVRRTLKAGVRVGDRHLTAAASVGVGWTAASSRLSQLLAVADMAMYRSKASGGDCVTLGRDRKSGLGVVELEAQLRAAHEQQEFVLHYQPIIDLHDHGVRGVEALIRWQHPTRGLVMPVDFIEAAERRHLMGDIGIWVIEEVCAQISRWRDELGYAPKVSINVSTGQLARPGLATAIARRAADAGIPPSALQLEITESQLLNVDRATLAHLAACRDVGPTLAIDDFGTGHAGFDYLRRIPAQILKVDKTFIEGLGVDTTDTAIVTGVIAVGHGLGLTLVAEGVERQEQADLLVRLGCDAAQGWLWAPAVPADDVLPMLRWGV